VTEVACWQRPCLLKCDRGRVLAEAVIREFKKATRATGTGTSLNKRFNEQNNGCARAL